MTIYINYSIVVDNSHMCVHTRFFTKWEWMASSQIISQMITRMGDGACMWYRKRGESRIEALHVFQTSQPFVPFILICVLWKHVMIALPIPIYKSQNPRGQQRNTRFDPFILAFKCDFIYSFMNASHCIRSLGFGDDSKVMWGKFFILKRNNIWDFSRIFQDFPILHKS